jgi:hypothetical protein
MTLIYPMVDFAIAVLRDGKPPSAGRFKLVIVRDSISGEWIDVDQYPA